MSDVGHFIIDLEDEDCPRSEVHVAAYKNDAPLLSELLASGDHRKCIDQRIRPFLSTPLRLAATGQTPPPSRRACEEPS
jgi:hypothetical protein